MGQTDAEDDYEYEYHPIEIEVRQLHTQQDSVSFTNTLSIDILGRLGCIVSQQRNSIPQPWRSEKLEQANRGR